MVGCYFTSTDVIVSEEYVLLDLGTLLSVIGGNIGMFLGWSALDLIRTLSYSPERALSYKWRGS